MAIVWVYAMVRVDPTLSTLTIESARLTCVRYDGEQGISSGQELQQDHEQPLRVHSLRYAHQIVRDSAPLRTFIVKIPLVQDVKGDQKYPGHNGTRTHDLYQHNPHGS